MEVKIKRVYEAPLKEDGVRILVDRLWPRGISKDKGRIDIWLKEIAPSTELRKWYDKDPGKWDEFRKRYITELNEMEVPVSILKEHIKKGTVTLLYGKKDEEHNQAIVLKEYLGV
jgi:uncharacterized protein YeaO (DUF488 family)